MPNLNSAKYYAYLNSELLSNPIFIAKSLKNNPDIYHIANTKVIQKYREQFLNSLHSYHQEKFFSFLEKSDFANIEKMNTFWKY